MLAATVEKAELKNPPLAQTYPQCLHTAAAASCRLVVTRNIILHDSFHHRRPVQAVLEGSLPGTIVPNTQITVRRDYGTP